MSADFPTVAPVSVDDARALTDEIRSDAQLLWLKLLEAHDRKAHVELGYSSWADYCEAEFDLSRNKSYRLLRAAQVIEHVEPESPIGTLTITNERVAREFTPLLDDPRTLSETQAEAVATAPVGPSGGVTLTSEYVRQVVQKHRSPPPASKTIPLQGSTICPGGDVSAEPNIPTLNAAVTSLKRALARDTGDVNGLLELLKLSASAGLYRPGNDAPAAVRELIDVIAMLVAKKPEAKS